MPEDRPDPMTPKQIAALPDADLARIVAEDWFGPDPFDEEAVHALAGLLQDDSKAPLAAIRMMAYVQRRASGLVGITPPRPSFKSHGREYAADPCHHVYVEWDGYPEIGAGPTPLRALVVALAYLIDGLEAHSLTRSNMPDRGAMIEWGAHKWATSRHNIIREDEWGDDLGWHNWLRNFTAPDLERATKGERVELYLHDFGDETTELVTGGCAEKITVPSGLAYRFRAYTWQLVVNGDKRLAEVLNDDGEPVAYVMPSAPVGE